MFKEVEAFTLEDRDEGANALMDGRVETARAINAFWIKSFMMILIRVV